MFTGLGLGVLFTRLITTVITTTEPVEDWGRIGLRHPLAIRKRP